MKIENRISMMLMTTIAGALFSVLAFAGTDVPQIGASVSSASTGTQPPQMSRMAFDESPDAVISITPILLASQPSPSWGEGADKAISDLLLGKLTNTVMNGPGDYALCNYRIGWANLVYSQSTPLWYDTLSPPAPYDHEQGQVVWALIDVISSSGLNDVSLDMIQANFISNDGVLNGVQSFGGMSYSPRAIAVQDDGRIVNSGPASQKGARVIVFVQSKLFNGGATQDGLDQVKNWVLGKVSSVGDYTLTFKVQIAGNDLTASQATVGVTYQPRRPTVRISPDGTFSILNAQLGVTYRIFTKDNLNEPGGWQFIAVAGSVATTTVDFPGLVDFTAPARYFKVAAQ